MPGAAVSPVTMLHAINHKKAKLSAFQGAGNRVPIEDIVTSTVFGTLNFLRAEDRHAALTRLLDLLDVDRPAWTGHVHLVLWPKKPFQRSGFRSNYVEPDAEVGDGTSATLIVEVKWGAPLSDRELSSQWLCLPDEAKKLSRHLLLVLEPHQYAQAVKACRRHIEAAGTVDWPLEVRSWRRVAEACQLLAIDASLEISVRHWAQQVQIFLKREDPFSLCGWDSLKLPDVGEQDWEFSPQWFADCTATQSSWRFK